MADETGEPDRTQDPIVVSDTARPDRDGKRPKRFFKAAHVKARNGAHALLLDGRTAKTPARRDLALPTALAAQAVADEWNGLDAVIDPAAMPLTRIVNAAIDGVAGQMDEVLAEIVNYVGSDLLIYRAGEPAQLATAQAARWDPVLQWCRQTYGVHFVLAEGLMPVAQPPETLAAMRRAIAQAIGDGLSAPFRLAALDVMTTLTGSALLGLAVMQQTLAAEQAWDAAHVDETFQESRWGQEAEALARRAARWREMQAAARLGSLA